MSRTSSISDTKRLTSTDDSAYSEVYSTIEELCELADPFDEEPQSQPQKQPQTASSIKPHHVKSASSSSTLIASSTLGRTSTLPPKPAPPLPPRLTQCRPPARPPYPSTHVKQRSMWKFMNLNYNRGVNKKISAQRFVPVIFQFFSIKMLKPPTEKIKINLLFLKKFLCV